MGSLHRQEGPVVVSTNETRCLTILRIIIKRIIIKSYIADRLCEFL